MMQNGEGQDIDALMVDQTSYSPEFLVEKLMMQNGKGQSIESTTLCCSPQYSNVVDQFG